MKDDSKGWSEVYDGGSAEAEHAIFLSLADQMLGVQEANRRKAGADEPARTLHAKLVTGVANASLVVDRDLPAEFAVTYFQPGASVPAHVRFSNASGVPQHDSAPDMRGAAVKIMVPDGGIHDLLMTNFPVSHARNARQFVEFAVIVSGDRTRVLERLVERFGAEEARRMTSNIGQGVRVCPSLALETFWSRGAVLWGPNPVRFQLRPVAGASAAAVEPLEGSDALRAELARRLTKGPVHYRLALQRFVDEAHTPIEDGAVEWREDVSPPIEVATLVVPKQDLLGEAGVAQAAVVDGLAFNPWNAPPEFRPLGNLNRVRRVVYGGSAEQWQRRPAS